MDVVGARRRDELAEGAGGARGRRGHGRVADFLDQLARRVVLVLNEIAFGIERAAQLALPVVEGAREPVVAAGTRIDARHRG